MFNKASLALVAESGGAMLLSARRWKNGEGTIRVEGFWGIVKISLWSE